jgi:hypothetical protein
MLYACDGEYSSVFNNVECRSNPKKIHEYANMISAAYFYYDFLFMVIFCKNNMPTMYIHHVVALSSYTLVLLH